MVILTDKFKKLHKFIKLDKPLVIFDLETTGIAISKDKIVEFSYIKIWPDSKTVKDSILFNPEIKIAPEAVAIHGIRNQDVKDKPKFRERAQELWDILHNCYYGGFAIIDFDLLVLRREFIRVGMDFNYNLSQVIDTKAIFQYMVPRTLASAYEYYCHKDSNKAHRASINSEVAAEILVKQLERYNEARDWNFINKINQADYDAIIDNERRFYWRKGKAYFAFSKYKDKSLARIAKEDPSFLRWILSSDFSEEMKTIVKKALEG